MLKLCQRASAALSDPEQISDKGSRVEDSFLPPGAQNGPPIAEVSFSNSNDNQEVDGQVMNVALQKVSPIIDPEEFLSLFELEVF